MSKKKQLVNPFKIGFEIDMPSLPDIPQPSISNDLSDECKKCNCLCHFFGSDSLYDHGEECFMCGCTPRP